MAYPLWALNGDLGGRHHDGDLINPLYIHIYFLLHLLYYYANPRFKSTRETGVYHDRPGPCIARLLDPDRRRIADSLLPVIFS